MSERRYGAWNQNDSEDQNERRVNNDGRGNNEPNYYQVREVAHRRNRRIQRRGGDSARDFFYWFASNGGLRALPRIIAVIAAIVMIIIIVANRKAFINGLLGVITELIPIAIAIWLFWYLIRSMIHPR